MNQKVMIDIGAAFGLDTSYQYETVVPPTELGVYVPPINPYHKFSKEFVRETLEFLDNPWGDALKIVGPTGSGKSSGITQVCARLGKPMMEIGATGSLEFLDLVGGFQLVQKPGDSQPVMDFVYGPLSLAMKMGSVLVINEYDYASPDEMAGLNDIIQGAPLFVHATGEIINPHPEFRLVVTGNTNGTGDSSRLMLGTQRQNLAANDRYRVCFVGYLDEDSEIDLMLRQFPMLDRSIAKLMVTYANAVRDQFLAEKMNAPLTTRALLRWAHLMERFARSEHPASYALDIAFLRSINETDAIAADKIAQGIFGADWR